MINRLVEYLKNKKILILGCGLEGFSTYSFIRKHLPEQVVYIEDENIAFLERFPEISSDKNAVIIPQKNYLKDLEDYDIIMKTPGLSFAQIDTSKFLHNIKSQLELFLEFVDVFTIGVTGTKGKSTTSSLIYNIIKNQKEDVHLLGNIGVPLWDEIDVLNPNSVVIMELSSHQLEFVEVAPNISIILNLFEEHLDHYKSYEHYMQAKLNICRFQNENDYFLYSIDNNELRNHVINFEVLKPQVYEISFDVNSKVSASSRIITRNNNQVITEDGEVLFTDSENRKILGDHNLNNIMFAMTVAKIMNLDIKQAEKDVFEFEPLAHRMEFVGYIDGVKYYNDSIATIPASTINGVNTLKEVSTLIIGGKDRGIDYTEFAGFLSNSNIKNLICLPDTGWKIAEMVKNENMKKYIVKDMKEAVNMAKQYTKKEGICLLSPAASSYGFFKNFQERGNLFKELVKEKN